ncbi:MAG: HD domain-containing protein [Ruminococcaceae bacterium]|nr:HD domain-containing protein [Oscillospiraceae bacterium]
MNIQKEQKYIDRYIELTGDLLRNDLVRSMNKYHHHREVSTHFHSVYVSYNVLKVCEKLSVQKEHEIVRAALLHDFYLYEWYTEKHDENHIYYHPKESVKNIEKYIGTLSPLQKNMILSHMFPTTKVMPKYAGSWILTLTDKRCATADYLKISRGFVSVYDEINRRTA